jgi:hypothetical protein
MKEMLMKMCKSRKFWYGFSMVMVIMFSDQMGISAVKMNSMCMVGVALIIAQGVADMHKDNCCGEKKCKK